MLRGRHIIKKMCFYEDFFQTFQSKNRLYPNGAKNFVALILIHRVLCKCSDNILSPKCSSNSLPLPPLGALGKSVPNLLAIQKIRNHNGPYSENAIL